MPHYINASSMPQGDESRPEVRCMIIAAQAFPLEISWAQLFFSLFLFLTILKNYIDCIVFFEYYLVDYLTSIRKAVNVDEM